MGEPPVQHSPGSVYVPGMTYRLWTQEHTDYETAKSKGHRAGVPGDYSGYVEGPAADLRVRVFAAAKPYGVPKAGWHPEDGTPVETTEEGEEFLFNLGIIGFQETIRQEPQLRREPQVAKQDPEDPWIDPGEADRYADGAAADMVYGKGDR